MSQQSLQEGLGRLGLRLQPEAQRALLSYVAEIERVNPVLGLVKASASKLISHHLLDSLSAVPLLSALRPNANVVDIGTGAGFPGLPLAIALPEIRWLLVDRSEKRVAFLARAVAVLGLTNVVVQAAQAQDLAETYDIAVVRAVGSLEELAALIGRTAAPIAHRLVAFKGRRDQIDAELAALPAEVATVSRVDVPGVAAERHLVTIDLRHSAWRTA